MCVDSKNSDDTDSRYDCRTERITCEGSRRLESPQPFHDEVFLVWSRPSHTIVCVEIRKLNGKIQEARKSNGGEHLKLWRSNVKALKRMKQKKRKKFYCSTAIHANCTCSFQLCKALCNLVCKGQTIRRFKYMTAHAVKLTPKNRCS